MDTLFTVLGVAIIAVGLNDIFHTLLHPSGRGRLSHGAFIVIWWVSKRLQHRLGHIAGPLAMVMVIAMWAALQTLGWALIYYPHMPGGFSYSPGLDPSWYNDFAESLYVSLVTLTTLGYGDVVAKDDWIRFFSPLQALIGFSLLTAALSWFSQLYPAQARRRTLSLKLQSLADAGYVGRLTEIEASTASRVLDTLTEDIIRVRVDLTQNSELYYFRENDVRLSLAASIHHAVDLSSTARMSSKEDIQLSGIRLSSALDEFSEYLRHSFPVSGNSTREILDAVSADHGYAPQFSDQIPPGA